MWWRWFSKLRMHDKSGLNQLYQKLNLKILNWNFRQIVHIPMSRHFHLSSLRKTPLHLKKLIRHQMLNLKISNYKCNNYKIYLNFHHIQNIPTRQHYHHFLVQQKPYDSDKLIRLQNLHLKLLKYDTGHLYCMYLIDHHMKNVPMQQHYHHFLMLQMHNN